MKKFYYCLYLVCITFGTQNAFGQWDPFAKLTFDPLDTLWQHVLQIDTINCHHNIWQVGRPQKTVFNAAYSGPNAILTDTLYPYPPNDTSSFVITFPGKSNSPMYYPLFFVHFYYKLNIDSNAKIKIEYSCDSGHTWVNIYDSLPHDIILVEPLYSSIYFSDCYIKFSAMSFSPPYPPSYYNNDSLKLKFTFISGNDTTSKDGWMLDDIMIDYYLEDIPSLNSNNNIHLFPNPSKGELTITSNSSINHISINNILGQQVFEHVYDANRVQIDVADLPKGIYYIRVNKTEVKKFIKE